MEESNAYLILDVGVNLPELRLDSFGSYLSIWISRRSTRVKSLTMKEIAIRLMLYFYKKNYEYKQKDRGVMLIQSSVSYGKLTTRLIVRKMIVGVSATALLMLAVMLGQNILFSPRTASAAVSPDACFNYTTASGQVTITDYYAHEGNNSSNPACARAVEIPSVLGGNPVVYIGQYALDNDQLVSVILPAGVTSIGQGAFYNNKLTSVTIPDGVTSIGDGSFSYNMLTSVTIPNTVTYIGYEAFQANKLTAVTIPDSVTNIDPISFSEQNPWGGDIENNVPGVPYIFSRDPSVVQQAYDSIWYVKLYTADPSNPNHLTDGALSEDYWQATDANKNGTTRDSLGGYIVNPVTVTINAIDQNGVALQAPTTLTGTKSAGGLLTDYAASASGAFAPIDAYTPSTADQAIEAAGFSQYGHRGQTVTVMAPSIAGYTLLSPATPATMSLSSAQNSQNFIYAKTLSSVDFSAPAGSATNPTADSVPSNTPQSMARSVLSVDTTKACSVITSAKLLPANNFTAPESSDTTLGGLNFNLACAQQGTDAAVSLTLDVALGDTSHIKVYKKSSTGAVTDITTRVTIANQTTSNGTRTVLKYNLSDGGDLDEDGVVNGAISDPIYLTVPKTLQGELAPTGQNISMYMAGGIAMALLGIGVVLRLTKR